MPNTIVPTQIGFIPYSEDGNLTSQIVFGKNNTNGVSFEAIGFGQNGRPDTLSAVKINFSKFNTGSNTYRPLGSAVLHVDDIYHFFTGNAAVPQNIEIKLREVSVCEVENGESVEKYMLILASAPYVSGGFAPNRSY